MSVHAGQIRPRGPKESAEVDRVSTRTQTPPALELSVVVPIYNEEDCLPEGSWTAQALDGRTSAPGRPVVVDDGSRGRLRRQGGEAARRRRRFRLLRFVRTAARPPRSTADSARPGRDRGIWTGRPGTTRAIPPADRQTQHARRRHDLGWRATRRDSIVRKISRHRQRRAQPPEGNIVRDVGCSIRVFRRDCIDRIQLYEGMHRFFPTLFKIEGYTIAEMPVDHRPREKGTSKYGISNRAWRGLKDLMAVRWMQKRALRYEIRPEK